MGTVFVLWLFTSAYALKVEWYVSAGECAFARTTMAADFNRPPRAFLSKLECIETYAPVVTRRPQAPTPPSHPSY